MVERKREFARVTARGEASNAPSRAPLPMALARPLFVGFSSASKAAREGGDLEVTVQTAHGPRTFTLPWFFVRDVDALLERWRREEHEATLLAMNAGVLGRTLCEAAGAGGLRDTTFLLARGVDVNAVHEARTSLMHSARRGHLAVVTALLDAGAGEINTALLDAAISGHTHVAALLHVHYLSDASLCHSAMRGLLEMARLLLDRGANVHEEWALREARRNGHEAVVALLLERGAMDIPA